jgi:hypothetical protein
MTFKVLNVGAIYFNLYWEDPKHIINPEIRQYASNF